LGSQSSNLKWCASSFALGLLVILAGSIEARQNATPQFRSSTDVVLVDVSVLDRSRHPVPNLSASDFTVLEDGVPQAIVGCQLIEIPSAEVASAPWISRTTLDVQTNRIPDGRVIVIYLDERTRSADPFFAQTAKKLAHAAIDQLAPNDVASVAFVLDHRATQEFTTDRGRLHAAVEGFNASPYVDVSIVGTLQSLSDYLGAIPERRKIIMYVGSGEPFDMAVVTAMQRTSLQNVSGGDGLNNVQQRDLYNKLLALFRSAQRSNVNIYALDPMGLSIQKPNDLQAGLIEPAKEFLRLIAGNTGGRAILDNNAPAAEVPAIIRENAAYYLIGFRPSKIGTDGRFRRIQVKVNRPNVDVRARRGYVEPTSGASAPVAEVARILPSTDVDITLSAIPVGPDPDGRASVILAIGAAPRPGASTPKRVIFSYTFLDMGGRQRATGRREVAVPTAGNTSASGVAATLALEHLEPGRYDIRITAQLDSGATGELIGDVTLPDFLKEKLSASGIIVEETPQSPIFGPETRDSVGSRLPTLSRAFSLSGHAVAWMKLYQPSNIVRTDVRVKAQVIDAKDKVVVEASDTFAAARFASGASEYSFEVPLSRLMPGKYLLRIEASRGGNSVVRRETIFEVR
jgi:VWFA-related protein